jgi:Ca-activated chloride channel homolog
MELAAPAALALAVLAVPVYLLARRRRVRGYAVSGSSALANARPTLRLRAARLLPALRVLAIVALAIAVAGPRVGDANAVVPAQGIDIALSMDISSSMNTAFGKTTRIEATKQVIRDFIKGRQNDRIGLVVFQDDALPLAPPTLDYQALDRVVADVKSGLINDGTGIGVGLGAALNMLRDSSAASRVVILLTDGQHNAKSISPLDAADLATALNVRVYTIGVLDDTGTESRAQVDQELLTRIANQTGGRFFSAENPQSLANVYAEIGTLETSRVSREHFERFSELAPWFAGGAAALLLLDLALRGLWLRRAPA